MQCSPLSLSLVAPALPPPRKIEVITKNALVEIRRRCSLARSFATSSASSATANAAAAAYLISSHDLQ